MFPRIISWMVLFGLVWLCSCNKDTKKQPKLNRQLIGAEMEFGRRAAEFELWREAIFRWEKVVVQDPQNAAATNNLAIAFESVGDYERAKNLYQKARDLDEDSREIRKNYKRFISFYKRHQRQLEREQRAEKRRGDEASTKEKNDSENKSGGER